MCSHWCLCITPLMSWLVPSLSVRIDLPACMHCITCAVGGLLDCTTLAIGNLCICMVSSMQSEGWQATLLDRKACTNQMSCRVHNFTV